MPKSLGKYSLLRELGRGGMGVVYEALDTELQRKVALKLLLSDPLSGEASGSVEEERFVREARLSAKLKHPNIVTVYEAGMLEGRRYLALQLIDGVSLSGWLAREAGAGLRRKVALLRDVALAVAHAHEQGVFHRDLKPQNVLLDAEGRPYVSDFGLARRAGREAAASLTVSGSVVGTPAYMSPEQARGLKTLDARSDVYSLGIMLYEMLAGRTPFQGDTPLDILMKVVNNPAPPPSSVSKSWEESTAGDAIETICLKAIAKDPRRRFPTARAFADDLGRWLKGQQILATPPAPPASLAWLWISIAAAAVVALGIVTLMPSDRAEREPPAKSARPPQGVDAEKERLTRERQAAADEAERVRRESAKEREEARLREAERAKRELELKTESAAEKEALTAKLRDAEARARAAEEEARKAKLDPPPKSVEPRVRPPEPAPKPEPPKPPAPPVFRKPAEPPAADLKAAEKALQGRFKEDYARKAPSEKRAFAARLLELGLKEDPDTTARFAILQEARELASLNGVPETAVAAVEALIRVFQVDARPLRSQTLQALAKSAVVATSMREAAAAGFRLSAGAVADDDYDAALQLLAQSDLLARRAADADLQSVAAARVREVTEVRREWGHVRAAFKTLQEKPDDAASNTAAGRFLCFVKQEWERGLPPLSRGDAEPLKSAALRDLAASTPETQMEAADAWLALSEKQPSARGRIADHALALYKRAWPAAQGGVKDALRAKLRSIAIHPSRATAPLPASWNPGTDSAKDAFTIEDGCPHSGRLAVRIAASAKPGVIGSTLKKIPQGRVCTLSGWILVDSQEAIGDILFINLSDGKNPDSVKNFIVTTPGDQPWWTFLQTTFTVPVGTASLGMQLKYGFKTGSVWVDDLSCKMDDGTELFENGGFEK